MLHQGSEFISFIENVMRLEPFTVHGRKALHHFEIEMTPDEFYEGLEKVYVEPFSVYEKLQNEEISVDMDSDISVPDRSYISIIERNVLIQKKNAFESRLKDLSASLFIIKGVGGSGKTTYVHKLKREFNEIVQFHYNNFEEVQQSFFFLNKEFDFPAEDFKNHSYKFIGRLLIEVSSLLAIGTKSLDAHRLYLGKLINIYMNHFVVDGPVPNLDMPEQRALFNLLHDYS